ncbi:MAG: alkene reductase [Verrucomicrobiota bacterium]
MSDLLSPYSALGKSLKNRVVLAPMTRARSDEDRIPKPIMAEYYAQRASAGLIITEATVVSAQGNGWVQSPGIYTDEQAEGWKQVVDAVHAKGCPIVLQLWHCGRASHSSFQEDGQLPVAPSPIKNGGEYVHTPKGKEAYEVPRALETSEIPGVVDDYRKAAERAKAAGFDGVEVHGANGYLIDQFLQSKTNHRDDEYGGSIENRYRFLKEVLEGVLSVWSSGQVGVRLAPNGVFNDMGSPDYREQFTYVINELNELNLGYLHVMDGLAFGFHELGEPMTLEEIRPLFTNPLMGNCGYSQEEAEKAIQAGKADLIAIGRPFISNPDLVERFANHWPLAPEADVKDWYSPTGAEGYTTFPPYDPES